MPPADLYGLHVRNTRSGERGAWATFVQESRQAFGWSKAELARQLGVDRGTVHRWETGQTRPEDAELVARAADVLDVDQDEALAAAGMRPAAASTTRPSRPPLDPDLALLMRKLADPSTPEADVAFIKQTLRYLAHLPERSTGRRRRDAG